MGECESTVLEILRRLCNRNVKTKNKTPQIVINFSLLAVNFFQNL